MCVARTMQKELRDIQQQLQQQPRGRRWRPTQDLRAKILAWVTVAQQQGQQWPDIWIAVRVDKARIKAWPKAAQAQSSASAGPLAMVPVQLAPSSMRDSAALITQAADIAERLHHHPEVDVGYHRLRIAITTHDCGGLTAIDFAFASQLELWRRAQSP